MLLALLLLATDPTLGPDPTLGYYRQPALHHETLVFVAEGDLWRVGIEGGRAQRLTSHPGEEGHPAISPDGRTLAFSASYEGPSEVYTMPLHGGLPVRRTWEGGTARVVRFLSDGRLLHATSRQATLPSTDLVALDLAAGRAERLPLTQLADADDAADGTTYFTRFPWHQSHTRRYRGGWAQQVWRLRPGAAEAEGLTRDFPGVSRNPQVYRGRVYFESDRDETMNIWSMDLGGGDLRQHTRHQGWDVRGASLSAGRIAYQLGADLRLLDLATGDDRVVPIRLGSDFDQSRERWIDNPMEWLTSAHVAPEGDRVVATARGQLFVLPAVPGRILEATRRPGARYREGQFLGDGRSLLALSDESGEVEVVKVPADGSGRSEPLTTDGRSLRFGLVASRDGRRALYQDKDQQLWLLEVGKASPKRLAASARGELSGLGFSPDGRFATWVEPQANGFTRLMLHAVETGRTTPLTSGRYLDDWPAWTPDGLWLYFLSDRNLQSVVKNPWAPRQPEPFFDRPMKVMLLPLRRGLRSPWDPAEGAPEPAPSPKAPARIDVDLDGIQERLLDVPVPPGRYEDLQADGERLYLLSREVSSEKPKAALVAVEVVRRDVKPVTVFEDVQSFELSASGKRLLVRTKDKLHLIEASGKPPEKAEKTALDLAAWTFPLDPREERRQMFREAWRLERDYFYDRNMHGLDWNAVQAKYAPLAERLTDRAELADLLGQMMSELQALHLWVRPGDVRKGQEQVEVATLGALLLRDAKAGGARVARIFVSDPDQPEERSPLLRPGVEVAEGDVVEAIDGAAVLSAPDPQALLRGKAGRPTLLRVRPGAGGPAREVLVQPLSQGRDADLRYDAWEYERRLRVERASGGRIGYVHLRTMNSTSIAEWWREFYPVHDRQGLIVDVRRNRGGNIENWLIEKLLRRAWVYWQPRVGEPYTNMQQAFRGHLAVVMDETTISDGELFAEGVRRLGLGKLVGTRTWGGEIWLSLDNLLVDKGIAAAPETGVYGPEGAWLIEQHGVEPDLLVDNLPKATAEGRDAQLDAAVTHLLEQIAQDPRPLPSPPPHPDKRR